jgi:autotransporter passenger strand-loop-strand repeat protein/ELWxxDGT repeat protein
MSGSEVLFNGINANGQYELWAITPGGSVSQITNVADANTTIGLDPADMTVFGTKVYFAGTDAAGNEGLWETNGSAAGTQELTDIAGADPNGIDPADLTVYGNMLLFDGRDANGQWGLWETDGTAAGTQELVPDIFAADMTVFNGKIMFSGLDGGLWETDGTVAGTHEVAGTATAGSSLGTYAGYPFTVAPGGLQPYGMVVLNGELLFGGSAQLTYTNYLGNSYTIPSQNLMSYNGSSIQVIDGYYPGSDVTDFAGMESSGTVPGNPITLVTINDSISHLSPSYITLGFYQGDYTGFWGGGLNYTNGLSGTVFDGSVDFLVSGQGSPDPNDIIDFNNEIIFNGVNSDGTGNTLWLSSGPTPPAGLVPTAFTACLGDLVTGEDASGYGLNPKDMVEFDNTLYFNGTDAAGHQNLWGYNLQDFYSAGTESEAAQIVLTLEGGEINVSGENPNGLDPDMLTAPYTPITAATAAEYVADPASVPAPDFSYAVTDTAANIEALSPSILGGLSGIGDTGIVATDASLAFTVAQAEAIEDPVFVSVPTGDTVTVTDSASAIEAMTPAEIAALAASGFTAITANDASVAFSVAQAVALQPGGLVVSAPADDTVSVSDTAADIETLTPDQIAMLALSGITEITATDASLIFSIAQAVALQSNLITASVPGGDTVAVADTRANITALTAAEITALLAYNATTIAEVQGYEANPANNPAPAGTGYVITATTTAIEALSSTDLADLATAGTGAIIAGGSLSLTLAQALALGGEVVLVVPSGDIVTVSGTAAAIAAMTPAEIAGLSANGVTFLRATDTPAVLTAAQAAALVTGSCQLIGASVADTAAAIEALTPAALHGLAVAGIVAIDVTAGSVVFTIAQAASFSMAEVPFTLPKGATLTVADSVADAEAMTTTEKAQIRNNDLTVGIVDTAAQIETLTPAAIAAAVPYPWGGANTVSSITAIDASVLLSIGQAVALEAVGLDIAVPANDTVAIADTAAAIKALTAAQITALLAYNATSIAEVQGYEANPANNPLPAGTGYVITDTVAHIEALQAADLTGLAAIGTGAMITNGSVVFSVAQATALDGPIVVVVPSGDSVGIVDTAGDIEGMSAAEIAALSASGITRIVADGPVIFSVAQAEALEVGPLLVNVPSGDSVGIVDLASNIEGLSATAIAALPASGVSAITATDASLVLSVDQALALEAASIAIAVPTSDTLRITDTPAAIEDLTAAQIAALSAYGVTAVTATGGSLALSIAQVLAFAGTPITIGVPVGDTITVADTVAAFEALTAAEIAALAATGLALTVADTASHIGALTAAGIGTLSACGVTAIAATDASVTLTVAAAQALETTSIVASAPNGDTVAIADSNWRIATLTPTEIAGLAAIGVTAITSRGGITLSVAQIDALQAASLPITAEPGFGVSLYLDDTAANIETLSTTHIAGLPAFGVQSPIAATGATLILSVAQAEAFASASLYVSDYYSVTIADTAANIEAFLVSGQLAEVWQDVNFTAIVANDSTPVPIVLTVAEAVALEGVPFVSPTISIGSTNGSAVTIVDTAANIEAMTPTQIEQSGVSAITATDGSLTLSAAQAEAIVWRDVVTVPTSDTVTIVDSAANIEAMLAPGNFTHIAQYTNATAIVANDAPVTLTVAGAVSLEDVAVPVTVPMGDSVTIADTAADIEALTPAEIAALPSIGVTAIAATDASVAFSAAQAVALEGVSIAVTAPPGDKVTLADVEANIDALTPAQIAALGAIGINEIDTPSLTGAAPLTIEGGVTLAVAGAISAAQTITFTGTGGALDLADTTDMSGTILGFAPPDTIDLTAATYDPTAAASLGAGNVLAITENSGTYDLQLDPSQYFLSDSFSVAADAGSGTDITLLQAPIVDYEAIAYGQTVDGVTVVGGGTVDVQSGGTLNGGTVSAGGTVEVEYGGTASGIFVASGGFELVSGTLSGGTVGSGGTAELGWDGVAIGGTIGDGGAEFVTDGGWLVAGTLSSGGLVELVYGGTAWGLFIADGGTAVAYGGGTLELTTGADGVGTIAFGAISGGTLLVDDTIMPSGTIDGLVAGDTIDLTAAAYDPTAAASLGAGNVLAITENSGTYDLQLDPSQYFLSENFVAGPDGGTGTEITLVQVPIDSSVFVANGQTVDGVTVVGGGTVDVGGLLNGGTVSAGGAVDVENGGTANFTTVSAGGNETISSGGVTNLTAVSAWGWQEVFSGGSADGTFVAGRGVQDISGGTANDTTISGWLWAGWLPEIALQRVFSGGVANQATLDMLGQQWVYSGGSANSTTVSSGGYEIVYSGGTADYTVVSAGGYEIVSSGGTASGTVVNNGGYEVVAVGGSATSTTVESGGAIDVAYLPYATGGSASVDTNGLLEASVGGGTYTQQLSPADAGQLYGVTPDGTGGTLLTAGSGPCYLAGTRIRTTRGEVEVESLRAGDRALSAFGGTSEIVWTGHRDVDCARHPVPADVLPVRIRAGAFGPGLPARDLRLSPDHAVFVDLAGDGGVLIPVRYLVNERTIVQEAAGRITYWHVECAQHDVLLAEDLPAESYLDTGNRDAFVEAGATSLHPDFAIGARDVWEQFACRPLVESGPALDAARAHLGARAVAMGFEPLSFQRVDLDRVGLFHAVVPPGTARVHLVSACRVPDGEKRRLGAAIGAITLDGAALPLSDPGLDSGFYAVEQTAGNAWRWTDGEAVLRFAPSVRPRVLGVHVAMIMTARHARHAA